MTGFRPDLRLALVSLLAASSQVFSQPIISQRVSVRTVISLLGGGQTEARSARPLKSGTPLIALARARRNLLSPQSKAIIAEAFRTVQTQASRLSPSGHFRIHYDTTGTDAPALLDASQTSTLPNTYDAYVDSVAAIFDYCWAFQVDSLGYRPPASDGGFGGGNEYDVFIEALSSDLFGYTSYDDSTLVSTGPGAPRYWAFTTIDNDYLGYRTPGMDGLRATAAHEFAHAIHLGGYGLWDDNDIYFFEMSAGWMEGTNFPAVHDYYFDVSEYFTDFHTTICSLPFYYFDSFFVGSERGIWGQYIAQRFGRDMMRTIWERAANERVVPALNDALVSAGTDLATEFALFSTWNYYTADRADTVHYYVQGRHYPRFWVSESSSYSGSTVMMSDQAYALSSNFYDFEVEGDTVTAVVANVDLSSAAQYDESLRSLKLELGSGGLDVPSQVLADGLLIGFGATEQNDWRESYLVSSTRNGAVRAPLAASPNPLSLASVGRLLLPVGGSANQTAHVYFLNSSLALAYSGDYAVAMSGGAAQVAIPSADLARRLSSGVYFVIVKVGQAEYQWKVAVIR
ncbi:MAG TPA: MXAN_6640 family putative metalloprotease [Bacteroidota bacterium]|nr:MXAN_6640 family putative metalloprotease [Bacteroidota bacterium]